MSENKKYGYTGKGLRVDLTTGKITVEPTFPRFDGYIGGTAFGYKVFWDEVPPETDCYAPENKLVIAPGPLSGTGAICSGRTAITTLWPTAWPRSLIASAHVGGELAHKLKFAGWDFVIIEGEAKSPVYLYIHNEKVEIRDASAAWVLSKDEDGHGYVDLMWSCARNAPADYTVAEGRGCHSKATSELDPGLVYQDEKEVYGEVMKWQKPVKDGYEQIKGGVERVSKLLEVTALPYEKQTQIRLLLDKATEVSDLIEKDGSWGAHASHYLQDRVKSALSYIDQAQTLLDKGGY